MTAPPAGFVTRVDLEAILAFQAGRMLKAEARIDKIGAVTLRGVSVELGPIGPVLRSGRRQSGSRRSRRAA